MAILPTHKLYFNGFIAIIVLTICLINIPPLSIHRIAAFPKLTTRDIRQDDTGNAICLEPECKAAALDILADMDQNVNPCEDFYGFACGGWEARHQIPADKPGIDNFDIIADENKVFLRDILAKPYTPPDPKFQALSRKQRDIDAANFQKVKNIYDACMDEEKIKQLGAKPILPILRMILEGYPVEVPLPDYFTAPISKLKKHYPINANRLGALLANMSTYGMDSIIGGNVAADLADPTMNALWITENGATLPNKRYYDDPATTTVYRSTIADTFKLILGELALELWPERDASAPIQDQVWSKMAEEITQFEHQMASVTLSKTRMLDPASIYNVGNVTYMDDIAPNIGWTAYLSALLTPSDNAFPRKTIPESFIVESPFYVQKISQDILPNTSPATLQAYLLWRAIYIGFLPFLSEKYQIPSRRLKFTLNGIKEIPPRWRLCLSEVTYGIGQAAGRYFILNRFGTEARKQTTEMITQIQKDFRTRLSQLPWLQREDLTQALLKVDYMEKKIGYSSGTLNLMDPESVQDYYKTLQTKPDEYLWNAVRENHFRNDQAIKMVGERVDKSLWQMNPHDVNAYYVRIVDQLDATNNEIVFPAGILQTPFFHPKLPAYLNYGGIATIAAHEITHGFDQHGRLFNPTGRMYSNYTIRGPEGSVLPVNGDLTLSENLADNGGLRTAYSAWSNTSSILNPSLPFPPSFANYTHAQLFFIQFARVWCGKKTPQDLTHLVLTDPHPPNRVRINGAIRNLEEFDKVWGCAMERGVARDASSRCELCFGNAGVVHGKGGGKGAGDCKDVHLDFTSTFNKNFFFDIDNNPAQWLLSKQGLELKLSPPTKYIPAKSDEGEYNKFAGNGPTFNSTFLFQYGSVEATIKPAQPGGAVTAFILMADNGDEVDYEWVGGAQQVQSNYFYHDHIVYGVNGKTHNIPPGFVRYKIERTPEIITWYVNDKPVRVKRRAETCKGGVCQFPNAPARISFGVWDGSTEPGTAGWANGPMKWNKLKDVRAYVRDVTVKCQ
ncbi:uncharacterized protein VTP21DRAFT_3094 [Calcarisporiella thermophila]|uniref:uncharacterized protein n=1 Tax=Calcarisporiella thermophila TaxID=911321 RepID=UPI003742E3EE